MDIRIRRAELADAPVITQFNLLLALESEHLQLEPARAQAGVLALLQDPAKGHYYLAQSGSEIVGQVMLTYEWSDWRNGNFWWIQSVYVKESFRRAGIFRQFYEFIRVQARAGGACALRLYVHDENSRAIQAYERLGMKRSAYDIFELELP